MSRQPGGPLPYGPGVLYLLVFMKSLGYLLLDALGESCVGFTGQLLHLTEFGFFLLESSLPLFQLCLSLLYSGLVVPEGLFLLREPLGLLLCVCVYKEFN